MRILIIEDDKDLAQLTKLALEKENFTVDMCLDCLLYTSRCV